MIRKTTMITKGRAGALSALVALALATPALAASIPSDAWITTKVKLSLATTEGVSATDVSVDTVGHNVTLHGTVNTADEKATAERTAKSVENVTSVRNLLQVVPARNEEVVEAKDDQISAAVTAALAGDESLKDSSITVQSVNKGVVLLKGNAKTLSDHLNAVEIAGDVKGVKRVASEIKNEDALADASTWKETNVAVAPSKTASVRSATNDLYITSMVKMRLLANADTPAMDINVDTRRGIVTLFGIVPSNESRDAAAMEAGKASGVASVKNKLQVVAAAKQPAVEAKDDVVETDVKKNLGQNADLGKVEPEVKNCVVRLTGSVPSGMDRVEAMQIARATKGVCSVNGDLTIQ